LIIKKKKIMGIFILNGVVQMKVYSEHEGNYRVCCSCDHRLADKDHCDIDGHYISYLLCFDDWCRYWPDKKYKTLFNDNGIRKDIEND
jgi:hypothetical protein